MGGRHFLPFHLRPHLLFDTDAPSSGASSSSWERWPFLLALVALGGPCIPRLGRGQRGQDLPPQEQEGIRESCCNFRHFRFDQSHWHFFRNSLHLKIDLAVEWFLVIWSTPNEWRSWGRRWLFSTKILCLSAPLFLGPDTQLICCRGEKTRLAGKKFLTAVERKRELQLNPENNIFSQKVTTASSSIS